jgi:hypothetical protein
MRSRTARATQRNPVSKKNQKTKKPKPKPKDYLKCPIMVGRRLHSLA